MLLRLTIRPIVLTVALTAAFGGAVDGGAIAFTRLSATHDIQRVGQAAASAVKGRPVTSRTAALALNVARAEGRSHHLQVQSGNFRIYRDGRLQLTATTTASTMLLQHLKPLRHLTLVTASATVTASPYS